MLEEQDENEDCSNLYSPKSKSAKKSLFGGDRTHSAFMMVSSANNSPLPDLKALDGTGMNFFQSTPIRTSNTKLFESDIFPSPRRMARSPACNLTDGDTSWLHRAQPKNKSNSEQSKPSSKPKNGNGNGKNRGAWTADEDERLIEVVKLRGATGWSQIANELSSGRNGRQCRERWSNQINPDLDRSKWTQEEDDVILEAHKLHGNKWATIAKLLPGRTDNMVKNRYNGSLLPRQNGKSVSADKSKRKDRSSRRQSWPASSCDQLQQMCGFNSDGEEEDEDDMDLKPIKKRSKRCSIKAEIESPFLPLKIGSIIDSPCGSLITPRPVNFGSHNFSSARTGEKLFDHAKPWSPTSCVGSPDDPLKKICMDEWDTTQPSPVTAIATPRGPGHRLLEEDELEIDLLESNRKKKRSNLKKKKQKPGLYVSPIPSNAVLPGEKTPQRHASIANSFTSYPYLLQSLLSPQGNNNGTFTPGGLSEAFLCTPPPQTNQKPQPKQQSSPRNNNTSTMTRATGSSSSFLDEESMNSLTSTDISPSFDPAKDTWRFSDNPCHCTKSRCLKLYCTCFQGKVHCGGECQCSDCLNKGPNQKWYSAYSRQYSKNPKGFCKGEVSCKCKSTHCLKKYCVCFNRGTRCGSSCTCFNCKNTVGKEKLTDGSTNTTMLHELLEPSPKHTIKVD